MAVLYVVRLATTHPEVAWSRASKGRPWEDYQNKQYKLWSDSIDYKNLPKSPAPKLD